MKDALTRYTPANYDNSMEVCEGGCWVDADEAEAELRRLESELTAVTENWNHMHEAFKAERAAKRELLEALKRLRSADSTTELVLAIQSADDAIAKHGG